MKRGTLLSGGGGGESDTGGNRGGLGVALIPGVRVLTLLRSCRIETAVLTALTCRYAAWKASERLIFLSPPGQAVYAPPEIPTLWVFKRECLISKLPAKK